MLGWLTWEVDHYPGFYGVMRLCLVAIAMDLQFGFETDYLTWNATRHVDHQIILYHAQM